MVEPRSWMGITRLTTGTSSKIAGTILGDEYSSRTMLLTCELAFPSSRITTTGSTLTSTSVATLRDCHARRPNHQPFLPLPCEAFDSDELPVAVAGRPAGMMAAVLITSALCM